MYLDGGLLIYIGTILGIGLTIYIHLYVERFIRRRMIKDNSKSD